MAINKPSLTFSKSFKDSLDAYQENIEEQINSGRLDENEEDLDIKFNKRSLKFSSGGQYNLPIFSPYQRAHVPPRGVGFISNAPISEPQGEVPDTGEIDKSLFGKGHTNDVNAYVARKQAAQQKLQSLVQTYGYAATMSSTFKQLVQEATINPNETNALINRKSMSEDAAAINKSNGGENAWVTNGDGNVLAITSKGNYEYVDRFTISSGLAKPLTSAEALRLNDVDEKLTNNHSIMPAVSQTWGGSKAYEEINRNMDKIGFTKWQKAIENATAVLGKLPASADISAIMGKAGRDVGGGSNTAQLSNLMSSLYQGIDKGARNYFQNEASKLVKSPEIKPDMTEAEIAAEKKRYYKDLELKTHGIMWSYIQKSTKIEEHDKQTQSVDMSLSKAAEGVGKAQRPQKDFLTHLIQTDGGFMYDSKGNAQNMIAEARDMKERMGHMYDPVTKTYSQVKEHVYDKLADPTTVSRLRTTKPGSGINDRVLTLKLENDLQPLQLGENEVAVMSGLNPEIVFTPKKDAQGKVTQGHFVQNYTIMDANVLARMSVTDPATGNKLSMMEESFLPWSDPNANEEMHKAYNIVKVTKHTTAESLGLSQEQLDGLRKQNSNLYLVPVREPLTDRQGMQYGQGRTAVMGNENPRAHGAYHQYGTQQAQQEAAYSSILENSAI